MKDILVSYTRQEKDEATGNYISVNHKGYIFNTGTAAQPTQWP